MKRFLDVFLSLVLFGALTACGGRTSTPLNATATSLPTRHPPTQTFTPVPAVTLRPSPTTNQISATSTEITPISTLPICDPCANTTADPTQILLTTQISTLNKFCGGAGEGIFFINPRWEICSNTQNGFIVFSLEGTVWNFSFSDVPGLPKEADYNYHIIRWTADENYLYLSPNEVGGGGPWVFGYSPMLLRLELKTGKLSTILPFTGRSYDISISPSDRSMAYVLEEQQPLKIIIQDFATGLNNSITLYEKYVEAGEFFGLQMKPS